MPSSLKPLVKRHSASFYVLLGAALFVFVEAFSLLSPVLLSLLLILLISLAVNPVIIRMRAWTGGRKVATGLVAALLLSVIVLAGWAFFGPIKASAVKFSQRLPDYWERLQKPLIVLEKRAVLSEEKLQALVANELRQTTSSSGQPETARRTKESVAPKSATESGSLRSGLGQMLQGLAGSVSAIAFNAAQILVVLVTVFFGVTFTLMNPRPVFGAVFSMVPERFHARTLTVVQRIGLFVPRWAGATLLGMLTIGLLVFLVMWPIFGFMDALVLGLIAGVFEAVPYLGPVLSAVPGILLAVGEGGMTPLWVLLAYIAIQTLEGNVILPLLMARATMIHPLAVILSILLCVVAFGVLGVLIAAPMASIAHILHDELYRKRLQPEVTDADLERLARKALHEKVSEDEGLRSTAGQ
jgi:predicted PurR-regulated permease PerM